MEREVTIGSVSLGITAVLLMTASASARDELLHAAALEFHSSPAESTPVLSLALDAEVEESIEAVEPATVFGAQDTWRWNIQGGFGIGLDSSDDASLEFAGVSLSYFLIDNFSLELELNFIAFQQHGPDAFGANFNLLVRWHIIAQPTWSFYLDGGAGLMATSEDVPEGTQRFNFTPQAGFGFTFEVAENTRLFVGMRLHHLSNANLNAENEGLDSVMAYAGVSFPF